MQSLLRAHELAIDTDVDPLQFAVEIQSIIKQADRNELRWLLSKGILAHYRETTQLNDSRRQFVPEPSMRFTKRSCFVLTESGVASIGGLSQVNLASRRYQLQLRQDESAYRLDRPTWDIARHTLRFGEFVVKQFRVPSPNQQAILSAFEEEDWPPRILDPLAPHPDIDPKRRLHDAIKGLNRNQKSECIRFLGDGTGEGVQWEPAGPAAAQLNA